MLVLHRVTSRTVSRLNPAPNRCAGYLAGTRFRRDAFVFRRRRTVRPERCAWSPSHARIRVRSTQARSISGAPTSQNGRLAPRAAPPRAVSLSNRIRQPAAAHAISHGVAPDPAVRGSIRGMGKEGWATNIGLSCDGGAGMLGAPRLTDCESIPRAFGATLQRPVRGAVMPRAGHILPLFSPQARRTHSFLPPRKLGTSFLLLPASGAHPYLFFSPQAGHILSFLLPASGEKWRAAPMRGYGRIDVSQHPFAGTHARRVHLIAERREERDREPAMHHDGRNSASPAACNNSAVCGARVWKRPSSCNTR